MARFRKISIGEALSELARRGTAARIGTRLDPISGLMVFDVPEGPTFGLEDVQRAMDEGDREYLESILPEKK